MRGKLMFGILRRKTPVLHWNHRVVRTVNDGEETYAVHEVYYDRNGVVTTITERAVSPLGETFEELRAELAMFTAASLLPVIDFDSIGMH